VRRAQIDDHIQTWRRFRWPGVIALSLPVTSSALLQLTRFFRDMIRQHKLREYADDPQAAHTLRDWQPNANHGTPLKMRQVRLLCWPLPQAGGGLAQQANRLHLQQRWLTYQDQLPMTASACALVMTSAPSAPLRV
jgi:hypothetical protein